MPGQTSCDTDFTELFVTNGTTCGAAVELFQESIYTNGYAQMFAVDGCPQLFNRFTSSCYQLLPSTLEYVSFTLTKCAHLRRR